MRTVPRRTLQAQLLYLWALLRRFRLTFVSLAVLVFGGGTAMWWLYGRVGQPVSWSRAVFSAYFLLFAQPTMEIPDYAPLEALFTIIPPLGIVTVAEGLVRFAFLFFAKTRNDKEWFAVLASTMKDHVILCGAGRVGFRVFEQFSRLEVPMVMIERREDAPFVSAIRAAGVAVLIEDVRSSRALEQANIKAARAIVCATDDDLVNLNIALDARRVSPRIGSSCGSSTTIWSRRRRRRSTSRRSPPRRWPLPRWRRRRSIPTSRTRSKWEAGCSSLPSYRSTRSLRRRAWDNCGTRLPPSSSTFAAPTGR